jgi:hypothetical protein
VENLYFQLTRELNADGPIAALASGQAFLPEFKPPISIRGPGGFEQVSAAAVPRGASGYKAIGFEVRLVVLMVTGSSWARGQWQDYVTSAMLGSQSGGSPAG